MARLILFLLLALVLAWAGVWVAQHPGQVTLEWGGWRVDTSAGVLGAAVVAFAVVVALLYRLWLFLTRAPGRIGQALKERRSQKGYKALAKGMVAVAAGDAEEARRQVGKADGLLGEPALTLLLKAQAAQLNGDETAAERFFTAMLDDPDMAFLGLRGLMNQALKRGDDARALELARQAHALNPKSVWLADALFALEAREGQWVEADRTLKKLTKAKGLSQGKARRLRAITLLGQSMAAETDGNVRDALKLAAKAVRESPDLTPAATHYARLLIADEQRRKAKTVLEKAWSIHPHPELADLYFAACDAPDGLSKVRAAKKLLALKPGAAEAHLAMAGAALEGGLWGEARTHLNAAMETGLATRSVYILMARLEEEEKGDAAAVREWLARAASAPADPAWVCGECGHVAARWTPHCSKCQGFDTLAWGVPSGAWGVPSGMDGVERGIAAGSEVSRLGVAQTMGGDAKTI